MNFAQFSYTTQLKNPRKHSGTLHFSPEVTKGGPI